jgi:hypothetical protein
MYYGDSKIFNVVYYNMKEKVIFDYRTNIESINSQCMIPVPELIQIIAEINVGEEVKWIIKTDENDADRSMILLEWE